MVVLVCNAVNILPGVCGNRFRGVLNEASRSGEGDDGCTAACTVGRGVAAIFPVFELGVQFAVGGCVAGQALGLSGDFVPDAPPIKAPIEAEPPVLDNYVSVDEVVADIEFVDADATDNADEAPNDLAAPAPSFSKPRVVVDNTREAASPFTPDGAPVEKPNVLTFAPKAKPAPTNTPAIPGSEFGSVRGGRGVS